MREGDKQECTGDAPFTTPPSPIMCTINQTYLEAAYQQSLADNKRLLAFAVACGTDFVVVWVFWHNRNQPLSKNNLP